MRADADAGPDADGRTDGGAVNTDVRIDGVNIDTGPACEGGSGAKVIGQACTCGRIAPAGSASRACAATPRAPRAARRVRRRERGTCVGIAAGGRPRSATTCAATAASTCGLDGTCDGAGSCRKHIAGTLCKSGSCEGDAVVGSFACDGAGRCKPGATLICVPYSCNPTTGACFDECSTSAQCVSGQQCVQGAAAAAA